MLEAEHILNAYHRIQSKVSLYSGARLIAVSKKQTIESIRCLVDAGHRDFGENYLQEWTEKKDLLPKNLRWHFIGQLQSKKLKGLVERNVHAIHSIGSFSTIDKLNQLQHFPEGGCFLQINCAEEEQKGGFSIRELEQLIDEQKLSNISGLMSIPPAHWDETQLRQHFKQMKNLNDQYGFCELSMGMSSDWEMALDEGATLVRVGSAIFGHRA